MKRGKPMRRARMRVVRKDHSVEQAFRAAVIERDGGHCVICTATLDLHVHHRLLRSRGGKDNHPTCLTLCGHHHRIVHDNPAWATTVGLMVPRWADPSDWPVLLHFERGPWGWDQPMLWQVPREDGTWICRAPDPDQHFEEAPWAAA